jgi:hypothetical protein
MEDQSEIENLAQSMFVVAERFHKASQILIQHVKAHADPDQGIAAVVNLAFAVEMYFKCLITLDTKEDPSWKHDYVVLFAKLTPETQSKIREYYDKRPLAAIQKTMSELMIANGDPEAANQFSFDSILTKSKDAFRNIRYIYQYPGYESFEAGDLVSCLKQAILDIHPSWKR